MATEKQNPYVNLFPPVMKMFTYDHISQKWRNSNLRRNNSLNHNHSKEFIRVPKSLHDGELKSLFKCPVLVLMGEIIRDSKPESPHSGNGSYAGTILRIDLGPSSKFLIWWALSDLGIRIDLRSF
jgi:hypothetical protein